MCPERQIISLYHDGELPSPWKEKLETHLEKCPECRAALSGYSRLCESLVQSEEYPSEDSVQAAQDRVWRKLVSQELVISGISKPENARKPGKERSLLGKRRLPWNRTITLPLPAAAAAAALIIAVGFFAVLGAGSRPKLQDSMAIANIGDDYFGAANIGLDDRGLVPMQDMNQVLQYLSTQDYGDYMVIRLPETRKFSQSGEPALINAADYSRRSVSR